MFQCGYLASRKERHLAQAGFSPQGLQTGQSSEGDDAVSRFRRLIEVMRVSHPDGESINLHLARKLPPLIKLGTGMLQAADIYMVKDTGRAQSNSFARQARQVCPRPSFHDQTSHVTRERGLRLCDGCSARTSETYRDRMSSGGKTSRRQHQRAECVACARSFAKSRV